MKLQHLLELINELSPNTYFKYIRSDEQCEYHYCPDKIQDM